MAAPDDGFDVMLEGDRLFQPGEVGSWRQMIDHGAIEALAPDQIVEEGPQCRRVEAAYGQRHRRKEPAGKLEVKAGRRLFRNVELEWISAGGVFTATRWAFR